MSKLYHISYEKERIDTLKLADTIKKDAWIDSSTIIVTCSPDYSSYTSMIINHSLSYLNKNELFENIFMEMPYPIMSQVWDRETAEYKLFDVYLNDWVKKYINSSFKYLLIDSATIRGKNFSKVKHAIRDKAEYKLASLYIEKQSIITPDYFVERYDENEKGELIFSWENSDNPNWKKQTNI